MTTPICTGSQPLGDATGEPRCPLGRGRRPLKATRHDHNRTTRRATDETEGDSVGVDDEAIAFWEDTCAAMPPMSPAAIEAVAITVRRIDLRRANGEPHRRAGVQLPRSRTRAAVRALRLLLSCPDLDSSATKVAPLPVRGSCCLASR